MSSIRASAAVAPLSKQFLDFIQAVDQLIEITEKHIKFCLKAGENLESFHFESEIVRFFRYHQEKKIIVFVWVNDDNSKRAYGSKTDACLVFKKMLEDGYPPDNWDSLIEDVQAGSGRLEQVINSEI